MYGATKERLTRELEGIQEAGLHKNERVIMTPQDAHVRVGDGGPLLNLCANNYLGLAEHPEAQRNNEIRLLRDRDKRVWRHQAQHGVLETD